MEGVHTTEPSCIDSEPVGTLQLERGSVISPLFPRISVLIADRLTGEPVLACCVSISILNPVACAGRTLITPFPAAPDELFTLTFQIPGAFA